MLDGYLISEEIHQGSRRIVHRATRSDDGMPVVIKSAASKLATDLAFAELKQEYDILSDLPVDGVGRAYDLHTHAGSVHLILEDRGGVPLAQLIESEDINLSQRVRVAIDVATILSRVHAHDVIHKDVNPTNILVEPSSREVTLIDFSISTRRAEEYQPIAHPNVLEGTLAYLAPEQTGRMNRPVDYRSDYYSLGVTLFELFTKRLPFQAEDPMELVHCHMAVPAPTLASFSAQLPASLGLVIAKLLEKAPEDRYQSAAGILHDLEICLEQVQGGEALKDFRPGEHDVRDRFSIPTKLYGREEEIDGLMRAFERVGRQGSEMVLVSGYSGIGKSSLVSSLQGPITARRGHFAVGKFDQLQQTVPYSAVAAALSELVRQLLTDTKEALARCKAKLQEAVGDGGQLIVDVIPDVEFVIGPQPPAPQLEGEGAKNRFRMVFRRFIRALSQRDQPFVLFLDDLQWADPASLSLMETILTDDESQHLLLIGAYRDNEVDDSHPLTTTLDLLNARGAAVTNLSLGPLSSDDLLTLLADTLYHGKAELGPIHALVQGKTRGNPFFVQQFLKTLHHNRAIAFDDSKNRWAWDVAAIDAMNITDNVVDLMVRRLKELPEDARDVLKMAACIGNRFDLDTLGVITGQPQQAVRDDILPALESGLVVPIQDGPTSKPASPGVADSGTHYRFLHDRVQQAAYSLIDEPLKRQAHLDIGRRLVAIIPEASREGRLFEIADHLNAGRELIKEAAERRDLAEINLQAARKAVAATAYAAGRDYAAVAQQCLPSDRWHTDYELTKALHRVEIDAEYLRGDFETSQSIIRSVLEQLRTPVERAVLHDTLIIQQTLSGKYQDAIDTTRKALALLGIDLPTEDLGTSFDQELLRYREAIGQREPGELIDLREMNSHEMRVAMRLLGSLCPLCYIADAALCWIATTKMVNLSLVHGNSPDSALGFSFFGLLHSSVLHEYDTAYKFGQLAMALADQFGDVPQACRTSHVFCAFINHWSRPLAEFKDVNSRGFQAGLQSGEHQYAGYHRYNRSLILLHLGTNLKGLLEDTAQWVQFGQRTRNQHATDPIIAVRRVAMDLCADTASPGAFSSDEADDSGFVADLRARNAWPAFAHYHIMKSQALYLYGRFDEALHCVDEAASRISFISGHISVAMQNFYESLILLASITDVPRPERIERVERNQALMAKWAESCPDNFRHKYLLVKAEAQRLGGDDWRAAELYDRAIEEAARNGFTQEEALCRERAGLFWLSKGMHKVAAVYLSEAQHGYELWGATCKAKLLAQTHGELLAGMASAPTQSRSGSTPFFTLVSSSGAALDFATVMKASRTISSEIDLDSLVKKLIQIAVETAGAQKGQLLLMQEGELVIEATSTVETGQTRHCPPIEVASSEDLPTTVINLVTRTKQALAVADAASDARFANDPVVQRGGIRSILCLPILLRGKSFGLLYLEHNLAADVFTSDRVMILEGLAAQAAISLQNARLYDERKQAEMQLREAVDELQTLKDRLQAENEYFREEIKTHHKFEEIVGRSPGIIKVLHAVETVAPTDATALILGETGTGKELVARAIHNLSGRRSQTMVMVNCAALPAGLIESELFGHEKGAFTGALAQKIGRFELADKGTLFLDEIGDLPLELQAKLLRVLQEGAFERIGASQTLNVDVRVVAATHRDLLEAVEERSFREDLYYRLNVFPIAVPSLRERRDDIPLLVRHFTLRYANKMGKTINSVPKATIDAMQAYPWPGNVRELQNVIERAVILCRGDRLDVGDWIPQRSGRPGQGGVPTLEDFERQHITEVLEMMAWRISGDQGAAKVLGLKPTTLESRMKKFGIRRPK